MSEEQKPVGDEPKAKKRRKTRGKPKTLNNQQAELVKRLKTAETLTEASKGVYGTVQAAYKGLQRARIVASDEIHELGLRPRDWIKPLARQAGAVEGAEPATREIFVKASLFSQEKKVTLRADDLQRKAIVELNKIYYAGDEEVESGHTANRNTVCVVVGDEGTAAALARLFGARSSTGPIINVDAAVHENVG